MRIYTEKELNELFPDALTAFNHHEANHPEYCFDMFYMAMRATNDSRRIRITYSDLYELKSLTIVWDIGKKEVVSAELEDIEED